MTQKELERAQEELRKSEAHFRSLIENSSDIITILDEEGVIIYKSASAERLLGYGVGELIGKNMLDFLHPDDAPQTSAILNEMLQKPNQSLSSEFRFHHKNGSWLKIEGVGRNVPDVAGKPKIILNSRDITSRFDTEQALKENTLRLLKSQAELQRTQKKIIEQERLGSLGQMASGIAHDFSNMLMPVLGFCELLLKHPENLDDKAKLIEYLTMINTAALDAKSTVSRLREFYRHRKEGEVFAPLSLKKIVEQVVFLTQPKWKDQALANGKTVHVQAAVEETEVWGNESSLREALTNLIFNAVDAMPNGGNISLRSFRDEEFEVLEISDTGQGMTEEVQKRCFDPFFSTKGKHGMGMGLAMVYGIVRRHEGTIDIRSEIGKGTTFVIRLPLQGALTQKKAALIKNASVLTRQLNVLLVDDEPVVLQVVRGYLKGDGHTADTACNGKEGVEKFAQGKYDLVITDFAMPEMNGGDLAIAIKKHSKTTPIIMLTGFGGLMKADNEKPEGVDLLLSKPLTLDELRESMIKIFPNPV